MNGRYRSSDCTVHQTLRRKAADEAATLAGLAVDLEFCIVADEHVFDDRETKADAATFPASPLIDAKEALGYARYELLGNSDPVVGNDQFRSSVGPAPRHVDGTIRRRVPDRVRQQVANHGFYFRRASEERLP
jgi:hypothetical protein